MPDPGAPADGLAHRASGQTAARASCSAAGRSSASGTRIYVSAVDADGNEVGGIRLPEVSVPVATYTAGTRARRRPAATGQIIPMQGSTLPFAATRAEREQRGDPRPSIEERYRDRDEYLREGPRRRRGAGRAALHPGEDIDLAVEIALERYDAFAAAPVGSER